MASVAANERWRQHVEIVETRLQTRLQAKIFVLLRRKVLNNSI